MVKEGDSHLQEKKCTKTHRGSTLPGVMLLNNLYDFRPVCRAADLLPWFEHSGFFKVNGI